MTLNHHPSGSGHRPPVPGSRRWSAGYVAGGRVVAAHLPGQNLAVALLLLDAGAGREPVGKEGAGAVLAKALEEGTAQRDATTFALAVEGLGTELATVGWTGTPSRSASRCRWTGSAGGRGVARRGGADAPARPGRRAPGSATTRRPRCGWTGPTPARAPTRRCVPTCSVRQNRWGRPLYGDPDSVAGLDVEDVTVFHSRVVPAPRYPGRRR